MRAQAQFLATIEHHAQQVGFQAPQDLQWYLALLLAHHLQDANLVPQRSFADEYFRAMRDPDPEQCRQLADTVLLVISVMPGFGQRRGLALGYYQSLAQASYCVWADRTRDPRGYQLSEWFPYLRGFLETMFGNGARNLDFFDPWRDK